MKRWMSEEEGSGRGGGGGGECYRRVRKGEWEIYRGSLKKKRRKKNMKANKDINDFRGLGNICIHGRTEAQQATKSSMKSLFCFAVDVAFTDLDPQNLDPGPMYDQRFQVESTSRLVDSTQKRKNSKNEKSKVDANQGRRGNREAYVRKM